MGDLEFHYQKLEEAKKQGYDDGYKAGTEANNGGVGIFVAMIILVICLAAYYQHDSGIDESSRIPEPPSVSQITTLPSDIGEYIDNDSTHFYKYTGNDGVTYVRHHYEPNDQLSKQGYYKADTGEYILITMSFYTQDGSWICNWRIDHAVNGKKQTVSKGADIVYYTGESSENCVNALVQALTNYDYDSIVSTTDGTEITPSEGRGIIGY